MRVQRVASLKVIFREHALHLQRVAPVGLLLTSRDLQHSIDEQYTLRDTLDQPRLARRRARTCASSACMLARCMAERISGSFTSPTYTARWPGTIDAGTSPSSAGAPGATCSWPYT